MSTMPTRFSTTPPRTPRAALGAARGRPSRPRLRPARGACSPGPPGPGGRVLDLDRLEGGVDVDRDAGAVGLGHVHLVLRVAVGVGLGAVDRRARHLGLRGGGDLGERGAGEGRLAGAPARSVRPPLAPGADVEDGERAVEMDRDARSVGLLHHDDVLRRAAIVREGAVDRGAGHLGLGRGRRLGERVAGERGPLTARPVPAVIALRRRPVPLRRGRRARGGAGSAGGGRDPVPTRGQAEEQRGRRAGTPHRPRTLTLLRHGSPPFLVSSGAAMVTAADRKRL